MLFCDHLTSRDSNHQSCCLLLQLVAQKLVLVHTAEPTSMHVCNYFSSRREVRAEHLSADVTEQLSRRVDRKHQGPGLQKAGQMELRRQVIRACRCH